ncbi:MAG TPA: PTS sugar transporter subunit IIA, partial [Rectinemataceae bacterium]|nr:PTS sugar transporter subunit IIA [Rectinemataceae bacterium]
RCVAASLKGTTKIEVIRELVAMLEKAGRVSDGGRLLSDVLDRESRMSTGMEHGIALPHARTSGIAAPALAVGIHKEGIDFGTIDGTPGRIIALIVSPANDEAPHMQVLASLGAVLGDDDTRRRLLDAASDAEVYKILTANR